MASNQRTYPNTYFAWYNDDNRLAVVSKDTESVSGERTTELYDTWQGQGDLSGTLSDIDGNGTTATATARGPLSLARYATAAASAASNALGVGLQGTASNTSFTKTPVANHGYWVGANQPANSPSFPSGVTYSTVSRLDFDNDTTMALTRGYQPAEIYRSAGTGNTTHGYIGGGSPADFGTVINRIDYANDSLLTTLRGHLNTSKIRLAAVSNLNFGYFGGGGPSPFSSVYRVDYTGDNI